MMSRFSSALLVFLLVFAAIALHVIPAFAQPSPVIVAPEAVVIPPDPIPPCLGQWYLDQEVAIGDRLSANAQTVRVEGGFSQAVVDEAYAIYSTYRELSPPVCLYDEWSIRRDGYYAWYVGTQVALDGDLDTANLAFDRANNLFAAANEELARVIREHQ